MAKENPKPRETWSSWIGFVWVATGAAVGLGNVWKFPYMAGNSGGSAFVMLYLFFVLIVAVPVMMAEMMLGKLSHRNAIDGFQYLAQVHKRSGSWRFTGYLGLFTLQLIFCFYSVVAGFSLGYLYLALTNAFYLKTPKEIEIIWTNFLAEPILMVACAVSFVLMTMAIVFFGVKKGIEKSCTLMMPGLFLVLIVLVGYAALSGGLLPAVRFLFAFMPEKIEPGVAIASLGHAFFTLAVGACAMMVYGSYLPKRISVAKSVFVVALLDVIVAILSGLAIFPLIFNHGLEPAQGPGLMFVSLPIVFATMPFGWFLGSLFFLLLLFAALSSSLSFAEPLVDTCIEKLRLSRRQATYLISATTLVGCVLCALSFNTLSHLSIFGRFTIFDLVADTSTNILLPIGGIAIAIFAGLVIKKDDFFLSEQKYGPTIFRGWRVLTLFIAPAAILIVLINSLIDLVS
jgi:NSS family neurotransmitter:Na+ symporter